jgi:NAD(P)H dehydrogenase (quinone)
MRPVGGALRWPMGDKRVGWVASDDIAAVAAKVLAEGPERHAGKNYYLSTDLLNGMEVAGVLSRATDRPIQALVMTPDDLALGVASGQVSCRATLRRTMPRACSNGRGRPLMDAWPTAR